MHHALRVFGLGASLVMSAACASAGTPRGTMPPTSTPRWTHQVSIPDVVKPFVDATGYRRDFLASVAKPYPYLGDFFGMQAIADVDRATILKDMIPRFATLAAQDEHSVTLRFKEGYTVTFYPNSAIQVMANSVPVSHAAVSGGTWQEIEGNIGRFVQTLQRASLARKYLLPNPLYAEEKVVYARVKAGTPVEATPDPGLATFDARPNAVLLVPESVHGKPEQADELMTLLGRHRFAWLAMEMLNHEQQPILDAFNAARDGTPAYTAARAQLVAYFAQGWNGRAGPKTSGEENYYLKLVEAAHKAGTKVYAAEGASLSYILFRYGETSFGAGVRSLIWAKSSPRAGRGAIFGGSGHYSSAQPINVQDFFVALTPGRPVVSLTPITRR